MTVPLSTALHAATTKTTPVDADELALVDSAASFGLKRVTFANFKAAIPGSGGGSYGAIRAMTTTGNIASTDISDLVTLNGAAIVATLAPSGFAVGDWVDILNIGTQSATISAGTVGINQAGNDTLTLQANRFVRVVLASTSVDPQWRAEYETPLTLNSNQFAVNNSAGTAIEARTSKFLITLASTSITANGTYLLEKHGDVPVTLNEVTAQSLAGTCSYKIQKNGTDINGHGTALAVTTTKRDTATTEVLAEDDLLTLVISLASSLTGIYVTIKGTRTAD